MDELADFLKARTGWNISTTELVRLHSKYFDISRQAIDYNRLMDDIRNGVDIKDKSNYLDGEALTKQKRHLNFDQIISLLQNKILTRIQTLKGENQLKKAYLLLGESRSPVVTRQQLKIACQSRLSIFLNDGEIEEVFSQLDKNREGTINLRQLINLVLKREPDSENMSIALNTSDRKSSRARINTADDNQNASITYDKKFKDLVAPDPARCKMFSVQEVEDFIFDRIFERSNLNDNLLKTTTKLFGDGENTNGYHVITLDMMRYTLWKRLKMNISDEDLQKFYNKHAKGPNGTILLFDFIEQIISRRQTNTPLLDDRTHVDRNDRHKLTATMKENHNIEYFLIYVRKKLNDLINRESRAPHYLLHGNTRMTENQAKDFLRGRLGVDLDDQSVISPQLKAMVLQEYRSNSLIDTKRILLEAMAIKEERVRPNEELIGTLPNQTLLNGATVCVDRMPLALCKSKMSPEKIEEIIYQKCTERLKNDHPHASLHKMFREMEGDPRVITRKGMKSVFHKFDIVMSPEEFDEFYKKHDRGDGKVDIHSFLRVLMPPMDVDVSPFVPKDPAKVKMETTLSHVMEEMTGRRHEVNWLNGPSSARTQSDFLQSLKPSSSGLAISSRRPSTGNNTSMRNNNASSTTSLATLNSNSAPSSAQLGKQHKSMSLLQTTTADNPNWNPSSATAAVPSSDELRSFSNTASSAVPATTTAGLTEQIEFAEALLKALKELPAYKQQQQLLLQQQEQQLHQSTSRVSTAAAGSVNLTPTVPSSPAPSRQGPRRPSSSSAASSAASSPNKVAFIASSPMKAETESVGGRRLVEKSSVALGTVPENEEVSQPPSSTVATTAVPAGSSAYHLQQSEHLLALAEAYARATGVLPEETPASAASSSSAVNDANNATANRSIAAAQKSQKQQKNPALKINLGKLSEPFVAPDPSTANLTHLLEQSSLLHVSPRASSSKNNNNNNNNNKNNKSNKPHRPATAPPTASSAHLPTHAKSSPSFHFKHLKVNQPAFDMYAPPVVTGLAATPSGALTSRTQMSDTTASSHLSSKSTGGGSKNQKKKRPAMTSTGLKHALPVNPYSEGLLDDYRLRKKILVTSNQEYGLFVKNLNRAIKQRAQLMQRQQQQQEEEEERRGNNNNDDDDEDEEDETKSNMTPVSKRSHNNKAATLTMIRTGNSAKVMSTVNLRPNTAM